MERWRSMASWARQKPRGPAERRPFGQTREIRTAIKAAQKHGPITVAVVHPCDGASISRALAASRLRLIKPILSLSSLAQSNGCGMSLNTPDCRSTAFSLLKRRIVRLRSASPAVLAAGRSNACDICDANPRNEHLVHSQGGALRWGHNLGSTGPFATRPLPFNFLLKNPALSA